jgi:hypothetical protein
MYDIPNYYLIANPISRYSIGDRTPGLSYATDGSLTITIQASPPADEAGLANWLPAPRGDFRPIMRLYEPAQAILDATYTCRPSTASANTQRPPNRAICRRPVPPRARQLGRNTQDQTGMSSTHARSRVVLESSKPGQSDGLTPLYPHVARQPPAY